jgi:hypothetical protein
MRFDYSSRDPPWLLDGLEDHTTYGRACADPELLSEEDEPELLLP